MTALIIIGVILLLFLGIAMTRLKFRIAYVDDIVAVAQVLFIKIRIYPKKIKRLRARNFRIKRFRSRVKRSVSRSEIKMEKARLRAEKKKQKKKAKSGDKGSGEGVKKKRDLKSLSRLLLRLLKVFIQKFPRYLQVTVSKFVIGVATEDAADTAITYGYVVQSAQYMLTYIKLNSNLKKARKSVVSVYPDFTTDKPKIELDVTLSIRIWQALALGASLALAYLNRGKKENNTLS